MVSNVVMSGLWKEAATVILAARCPKNNIVEKYSAVLNRQKQPSSSGRDSPETVRSVTVVGSGSDGDDGPMTPTPAVAIPEFDYKVLMLERSNKSAFMPNAFVFPGGKIHRADFCGGWCDVFQTVFGLKYTREYSLQNLDLPVASSAEPRLPMFEQRQVAGPDVASEIAFRICAIRETFEESGILLVTDKKQLQLEENLQGDVSINKAHLLDSCLSVSERFDESKLGAWREKVIQNADSFVELCADLKVVPNVWMLNDWSCWLTPTHMPSMHGSHRFDTAFYLGCLPSVVDHDYDDKEIVSSQWATPLELLCRHVMEEVWLAPPQVYELCRLCSKPDLEDLHKFAVERAHHGWQRWFPVRYGCEDGIIAVLPGDELYPTDPDYEGEALPVTVPQTIAELRTTTLYHHRFEFLGMHNTSILSTEDQTHGHLSPLIGQAAMQSIYKALALSAEEKTSALT